MKTYTVKATYTTVYLVKVEVEDDETEKDARDEAESLVGEIGERFLKRGELVDAWIDIESPEEN